MKKLFNTLSPPDSGKRQSLTILGSNLRQAAKKLFILVPKVAALFVVVALAASNLEAQCTMLNDNFSTNPVLAAVNTDGAWYPDRYQPAAFISDAGRLKISISASDGAQLRPSSFSSGFYNTQGRKFNQCGKCVTVARADLYIPAAWASNFRRSDIWATAFDNTDAISFYPIIGFRNVTGSNPQMSYWNGAAWVELGAPTNGYDTWYTLEFRLNGANLEYLIDNVVVGTIPSNNSVYFGDIIMQAYNFNDNTLGAFYDAGPNNSYDAFWDNLVTTGAGGKVVTNTNTGLSYCSIQSAIDDVNTLNGHTIVVGAGTYAETVNLSKSVTLRGPNHSLVPCVDTRLTEAIITGGLNIPNGTSLTVVVEGLHFQGVSSPMSYNGNVGTATLNATFRNNLVNGSSGQLAVFTGNATNHANLSILSNCFQNMSSNAMQIGGSPGSTVTAQIMSNIINGTGNSGINVDAISDSNINGNTISNTAQQGIQVAGASSNVNVNANVITNANTSLDPNRGGIRLRGTSFAGPVNVLNNIISGSLNGVIVPPGENITGKTINVNDNNLSGNTFSVKNAGTGTLNATCNWYGSASAATVAPLISGSVTYVLFLSDGTDSAPSVIGFQPVAGACTGGIPQLVAHVNNVTVTANNDGTTDTGTASTCGGVANNISITSAFQDLANLSIPGQPVRVYQTVSTTNVGGVSWCNNCQAALSAFTAGTSTTATLLNPSMPGTVVVTFQAWHDLDNNTVIDTGEPIGDIVQYTITVNPIPAISFTAQVAGRAAQNVNSATPQFGVLNFCAGESFSYSNYVSVPGNRVGVLEVLNGTGNVTYAGSPVAVPRAQIDFGVGGAPGYFNGSPYGPYGLSSGTFGQFIETFTPYYDSDNSGDYTPGDCVGNPISITYNVYALPNAIATPASQTICTNSSTNIALSSNVPGTTFSWVVQSTTGTVTGQTAGSGTNIAQTLTNSGGTNAFVTYRITPTGPAPNNCAGPTTDVIITVIPSLGITCQASFSVGTSSNGTGDCNGVANWTHPVQPIGSCSFVSLTMSINGGTPVPVTPGAAISQTFNVGTHTVAYVATDNASNTATCSFTITVVDDELPMVACKPHSITFNGQDSIALTVADLVLSSSDNCGIDTIVLQYNKLGCQSVGTTVPVVVTVTDINGNVNTCTANVTVGGLPCGWSSNSNSIGCNSNVVYTPGTGAWTNTASSCFYGPPFTVDDVSFAQRTLCGNGSITALVSSIDVFANAWAGITMRETNDVGAKKAQLMTNLSTLSRREFRTATNGAAQPQQFTSLNRYWLRIVRTGNQFAMYVSPNGTTWYIVGTQNIVMSSCIQIGLVTTNYTANGTSTCVFTNVSYTGGSTPLVQPGNVNPAQLANDVLEVEADFSVFPNPTSGALTLDLAQYIGRSVRIETYSLEGKLLQFSELDEVQNTLESLDLSRYQNGMYLVKVKSVGLPDVTRRVVKQ